jgi:hypothetical protein
VSKTARHRIVGFSGGSEPLQWLSELGRDARVRVSRDAYHDPAAALVCNGQVIAAIEEER